MIKENYSLVFRSNSLETACAAKFSIKNLGILGIEGILGPFPTISPTQSQEFEGPQKTRTRYQSSSSRTTDRLVAAFDEMAVDVARRCRFALS